jgi:hypothetical protein
MSHHYYGYVSLPLNLVQCLTWKCRYKQERQCTCNLILQARLCNHCYHGKVVSITFSECVCSLSYQACKAHVLYYMSSVVSVSTTFLHYLLNGTVFWKTLSVKCVCWFSVQLLILRTERDISMCVTFNVKYFFFLSDFNGTHFLDRFLKNIQIWNFMKIRQVEAHLLHLDGQTWS